MSDFRNVISKAYTIARERGCQDLKPGSFFEGEYVIIDTLVLSTLVEAYTDPNLEKKTQNAELEYISALGIILQHGLIIKDPRYWGRDDVISLAEVLSQNHNVETKPI